MTFEKSLNDLLSLIETYQTTLKTITQKTPEQLIYFDQLKAIYVKIKTASKKSNFNDCLIQRFGVLSPLNKKSFLPKTKTILQIPVKEDCTFVDETITINYQKGGQESLLVRDVIDAQNQATFFLHFRGEENNRASITIGESFEQVIIYTYHPGIKLDNSTNAKRTTKNLDPKVMREKFQAVIREQFPTAKMQEVPNASWKKHLDFDSIHQIIQNDQIEPLPDLKALSDEDLSSLNASYNQQQKPYQILLKKLEVSLQTFKALPSNYDGNDSSEIFGQHYETAVSNTEQLILALEEKLIPYEAIMIAITSEQNLRAIPKNIRTLYEKAIQILANQDPIVKQLKARISSYPSLELDFLAWEQEIETTSNAVNGIIQALNQGIDPLEFAVETLKKENFKTAHYTLWKTEKLKPLRKRYQFIQEDASKLLNNENLTQKIKVLTQTDGELELLDYKTENNFTESEKRLFLHNIPKDYKLGTQTPKDKDGKPIPLFEEGPQLEDIQQGDVSDCYLLAAMASLTNGEHAHLLEEMIDSREENGNTIYIVTLYQNGIPIKVEVDGKLMTLSPPQTEQATIPTRFLTAEPKSDIWVPIIEKAYAKLMGGGDYTLIENKNPQDAMQVLMGNKVQIPQHFYLDGKGQLSSERTTVKIANPIALASANLQQLQTLLQQALDNNYNINLASPKTYKGANNLNHNHVLNLGNGNYMSFFHIYTITAIKGDLVTVFNPHGKTASAKTFFDEALYLLMQKLGKTQIQLKEIDLKKGFSTTDKNALTQLLQQLKNSKFSTDFRQLINILEVLITDGLKEKQAQWIFAKKAYEKKFIRFMDKVEQILKDDIGKGFVRLDNSNSIFSEQKISLATLKQYFKNISINIIKK